MSFQDQYETARSELEQQQSILLATDTKLSALNKQRDRDSKALVDTKLQIQRSEHKVARFESDKSESAQTIQALAAANKWIESDKEYVCHMQRGSC
jgi:peptidoglycan hydrolase CwlO-like protein